MVDFKKKLKEAQREKERGFPTITDSVFRWLKKKKNRISLYKHLWKTYSDQAFFTQNNQNFIPSYANNPSLGCRILSIRDFLIIQGDVIKFDGYYPIALCQKVYDKYWERFINKYALPRVLKAGDGQKGPWPTMNRTRAILEFIARGFKYETDVKIDRVNKYCIKANIANLWWPEDFETHQDAIDIQTRFGITGLTGTTLPKTK